MTIFEIFTGLFVLAALVYYIVCILEIIGLIKFTPAHMSVEAPKFLIPFYYFIKQK